LKKILSSLLLLSILLGGCFGEKKEEASKQEGLTLSKLDGTPVDVIFSGKNRKKNINYLEAKGKVVLAVFWSTSCPPCRAEIPHLVKLQEKYKDKLKIYGLLVQNKSREEVKEFAEYFGINYDILYGDGNYAMADAVGGVNGIPAMFLYNKQGTEIKKYVGLIPPEMIEAEILKLF
jgi:thiol-disulfide isomerase/thioredoxin